MDFGEALRALKQGRKVTRSIWSGACSTVSSRYSSK
ncbi:Thoeris anti-defense Tad2 family protein [Bacillus cereus]